MLTVLGIDASTKTIGYSIIETDNLLNNPKLIICSYLKPPIKGNRFDRIIQTQQMIQKILDQYKPNFVGIEEIASFMGGHSTAQTIIALARINIAIGLTCYNYLGHPPAMCNVMSIRHGLKLTKDLPKKDEIPALIEKILDIKFPYIYEKSVKKKGQIAEETYDVADSVAVALYTIKHIKDLKIVLSKPLNSTLPKKRLNKLKKQYKENQQEYKEITGNEYPRSI